MELTIEEILLKHCNTKTNDYGTSFSSINETQCKNAMLEFAQKYKEKAEKWDKLEREIDAFYEDEDNEGDLCDIGEIAAMAFGYL